MLSSEHNTAPTASVLSTLTNGVALLTAAGLASPRLDAEVLLAATLGNDRTWIHTHANDPLPAAMARDYERRLTRRATREPLQYIVGRQEFWSLDFEVNASVLIPRPETELLIELALKEFPAATRHADETARPAGRWITNPRLCDMGTGSGCIAIALAKELIGVPIVAVDISEAALLLAARNAARHGVSDRIEWIRSDLLADVSGDFDAIFSNPPYLESTAKHLLQPELSFEPDTALFAGSDGLEVIDRLLRQGIKQLKPSGVMFIEIGASQAPAATRLASDAGFAAVSIERDLAGLDRVLIARK